MAYKSNGGCTPITAKIKRTTKGGITQPLLNVGAPVKMKAPSAVKQTKSHPKAEDTFGIGNKKAKTGFAGDTPYSVQDGKGTIHGPKSGYDDAYKKRDRKVYGEMSKAQYIKEAKKQTKSFESTGKFNAPKTKKATSVSVIKPKVTIESKKPTADVTITVKPKAKVAPKTKVEVRKTAKVNKKLSQAAEARAAGNEKKALRKEKAAMRKAARLAKKNK
jgi:hypothetical protein